MQRSASLLSRNRILLTYTLAVLFEFMSDGTAFTNFLEKRTTSFGSLTLDFDESKDVPFSKKNLRRLFTFDAFDKLTISVLPDEVALLPRPRDIPPDDFQSLAICAKDLNLTILVDGYGERWRSVTFSFLKRMAELDHLESLTLSLINDYDDRFYATPDDFEDVQAYIVEALIRVVRSHPRLAHLDVSGIEWMPYLSTQNLLTALEDHPGIRTKITDAQPKHHVHRFFKRVDLECLFYQNLCSLNRFYNGSLNLMKESTSLRPLLVATTLTKTATRNFRHTALLLSNHTDMLCELIDGVNLDDAVPAGLVVAVAEETAAVPDSIPPRGSRTRAAKESEA